jgi:hypothetical protein
MSHLPPAHHETSKRDSPNELKIKEKQKQKHPGFEFKPCYVSDSSQSNQVTVHLISQFPFVILMGQDNQQAVATYDQARQGKLGVAGFVKDIGLVQIST